MLIHGVHAIIIIFSSVLIIADLMRLILEWSTAVTFNILLQLPCARILHTSYNAAPEPKQTNQQAASASNVSLFKHRQQQRICCATRCCRQRTRKFPVRLLHYNLSVSFVRISSRCFSNMLGTRIKLYDTLNSSSESAERN